MPRRLLNPNALSAVPSPEDLRAALVSIWYLVSEAPITVTADYTTTGKVNLERLICTNTTAITVTLHPTPADGHEVIVNRNNTGAITVDGNGNTTNGMSTFTIMSQYDSCHLSYNEIAGEWVII